MKALRFIRKYFLAVLALLISAFFVTVAAVYYGRTPENVSRALKRQEEYWGDDPLTSNLRLEDYANYTKTYEYKTNDDALAVRFVCKDAGKDWAMEYGIVEKEDAPYNYYVECFVISSIADKNLVKRLWDVDAEIDGGLVLTGRADFKMLTITASNGDLQKEYFLRFMSYISVMRITVKSGIHARIQINDKEVFTGENNL